MQVWQRLLIIVPAGLVLGMIGGNLARPEMVERAVDTPWQAMFQGRADRDGGSPEYSAQPQGDLAYVGGYSYAPGYATQGTGWTPPSEDRLAYGNAPLPTIDQLDARQAALLADPEVEFAVHPGSEDAVAPHGAAEGLVQPADPPDAQIASAEPLVTGPEPSKADGEPAIW